MFRNCKELDDNGGAASIGKSHLNHGDPLNIRDINSFVTFSDVRQMKCGFSRNKAKAIIVAGRIIASVLLDSKEILL